MHDIGNRIFAKKNVLWVIEKFPKKETKMKEILNKITNAISQRGYTHFQMLLLFGKGCC